MNCRPGGRLLNVEDFNPQQAVSVNLRGVRHHGRDNSAFGLDSLVALKSDEVGNDLAGLQLRQEAGASVGCAESGWCEMQQHDDSK